jgi:AraC-like DNA-binding protein
MHSRPEEPWTVSTLADQSGISRSSFAARFTAAVGRPPLQYLTECRMRRAREMLRNTNLGIKTIAAKAGYSNESAFGSALKRASGLSPGSYRQQSRQC